MATIFLHIGMPKTGTSHLQRFLRLNEEALDKRGYVFPQFETFPKVGRARNAYFLRHRIYDEAGKRDLGAEQELIRHNFDLISELTEKYDRILLSEEGLWNSGNDIWDRYLEEAESRGFATVIIVYLRRQDLFLQSFWAQKVKENSTDTFSEYIDKNHYRNVKLDYYQRLNILADRFGKDNIRVRIYEKEQYEGINANLTSDYLKTVGMDLEEDFYIPDYHYNPSLNGPYLEVKRILNRNPEIALPQSFVKNLLVQLMKDRDDIAGYGRTVCFKEGRLYRFLAAYEEGNEKIAREYLNRDDGRLFYQPVIEEGNDLPSYSVGELVGICGDLLLIQQRKYDTKIRELKEVIAKKDALIAHKQEVIDWETTPVPKKVVRKIKKIGRQIRSKTI